MLTKIKSYQYDKAQLKQWNELLEDNNKPPKEILKGINLTIKRGEITALIGRNGAGKTTSANLIVKGYSPTGGEILIDGININEFVPANLRQQVAMIHQTPLILNGISIKDNLLLGVERAITDEEIWKFIEKVKLNEVISGLSKGLDTIYGEETAFSGGQKQLLAIVRVILQDRQILIFDEGTNQLDAEHEAIIMNMIKALKKEKAIFIITHKMTTARHSDKIYVMDEGLIKEEGNHSSLLQIPKGIYKKFWELQVVN
jgi:ABC-type multidrug transport system fused ATPase/permease subunit